MCQTTVKWNIIVLNTQAGFLITTIIYNYNNNEWNSCGKILKQNIID